MHKIDIAVVGGGPGGLAAANSILRVRPQLKLRVFEKAKQLRPVGFTIGLQANGWTALEAIGPDHAKQVERVCLADGPTVRYDEKGAREIRNESAFGTDAKLRSIAWHALQHTLFEFLPAGTVQLNSPLENLRIEEDGVILQIAGQSDVHASVIIGCDGNQSIVRQCILHDGPPTFLNRANWRGQTNAPADWSDRDNRSTWYRLSKDAAVNIARLGNDRVAWLAGASYKPEDLPRLATNRYVDSAATESADRGKVDRCLEALGGVMPPVVRDIIMSTRPSSITEHGMFYRDPAACTTWGKGPVTLLGDAAHLCTPMLAQGTNMALEDAVELGRAIGKLGPTEAALREYEAVRMPRATRVQAASVALHFEIVSGKPGPSEILWLQDNPWLWQHEMEPLVAASGPVAAAK